MSSDRLSRIPGIEQAPYVGALLRMAHQVARGRIIEALGQLGLDDLNPAYFGVFQYPPADGMRPSDLARRLGISKQALNHILGQLERLGYLQRRAEPGGRATTIAFTERGWLVLETTIATMRTLETDWRSQIGEGRFAELKTTLKALAGVD
ncbi:MAG: MarR family transcriptional regulator [Caulobacteraceae bacterium]|nr:MarR family transcriptional regulator [Caulobacteraceae bacterium]